MGRPCEDCSYVEHERRTRCPQCGCLICDWCYGIHKQDIANGYACRTQLPATINRRT